MFGESSYRHTPIQALDVIRTKLKEKSNDPEYDNLCRLTEAMLQPEPRQRLFIYEAVQYFIGNGPLPLRVTMPEVYYNLDALDKLPDLFADK